MHARTKPQALHALLLEHYCRVREHTLALTDGLSAEDCCVQSMPDASPVKWHLAHTTWFFETFILEAAEPHFQPFHPAFRVLFNSYYNSVGDKHPRPQRGLLTRPSLEEVRRYRANVDARIRQLLTSEALPENIVQLVVLGLHHEQQHQELMQTDFKHALSCNPLRPAWGGLQYASHQHAPRGLTWHRVEAGVVEIGVNARDDVQCYEDFVFDNECPRHRQFAEAFTIASRVVSKGEYLRFIEDGGYQRPELWLSEGWDWVNAQQVSHPLYWQCHDGHWTDYDPRGQRPIDPHAPLVHVSYFEADAFARWVGARLPTEAEWEVAAARYAQNLRESGAAPDGGRVAASSGDWFGTCWQWTASSYLAYSGFRAAEGAVSEYNGKFMCNQMVLRGSSCATPSGHARLSYRNFFPTYAQWQFAGIRLAGACGPNV